MIRTSSPGTVNVLDACPVPFYRQRPRALGAGRRGPGEREQPGDYRSPSQSHHELAFLGRSFRLARVKRVRQADKSDGRTIPGREEYLDRCPILFDSRTPLALCIELAGRVLSSGDYCLVALLQALDSANRRPIVDALAGEHLMRPADPRDHESGAAASPHH